MNPTHAEDELPEVLVRSKQKGAAVIRKAEELIIGARRRRLGGVVDIVSGGTKTIDNLAFHALVGEEVHAALSGIG